MGHYRAYASLNHERPAISVRLDPRTIPFERIYIPVACPKTVRQVAWRPHRTTYTGRRIITLGVRQ